MKHVFMIGCKGLPARYGGFETFTECLVSKKQSKDIQYHVACMGDDNDSFQFHGADCYRVKLPKQMGPAKVIYYDLKAMSRAIAYVKKHQIKGAVFYMLGCTSGPFMLRKFRQFKKYGISFFINPDGHEWKRGKWSRPVQLYLKFSEKVIIEHSDLVISDSTGIESYVKKEYAKANPKTTFIAYGADLPAADYGCHKIEELNSWYAQYELKEKEYYLIVGRFVPENNYETMLQEYMRSHTKKKLVIITNAEKNSFYEKLKSKTHFDQDARICFAGTVYDSELLYLIRKHAFAYLHGHEVGGTNPSLLESLASTDLNLLLQVDFNESVGLTACRYFTKEEGNLAALIHQVEQMSEEEIHTLGIRAKERIAQAYNWPRIIQQYESVFLEGAK